MSLTVFGSFGIFPSCSGSDSPSANPIIKCNEVFSALGELGDKNNIKAIFKTEKERGFLLLPLPLSSPYKQLRGYDTDSGYWVEEYEYV